MIDEQMAVHEAVPVAAERLIGVLQGIFEREAKALSPHDCRAN